MKRQPSELGMGKPVGPSREPAHASSPRRRVLWSLVLISSLALLALLHPGLNLLKAGTGEPSTAAPSASASSRSARSPAPSFPFSGSAARVLGYLRPYGPSTLVPVQTPLLPGTTGLDDRDLIIDGVNYGDPAEADAPLLWIRGREEQLISPSFRLTDFAPRDGSSMVRIDPVLLEGLERLREHAGRLAIVSGYRHAAYNATVGGVADSYHTAGQAADVWAPDHSPVQLARMALLTMGCDVGLGLGLHTLHIDIRGELTTWTYDGAPLREPAFDAWALTQCGRPVPPWLAAAAAAAWLEEPATPADSTEVPSLLQATIDPLDPEALLQRHRALIAETVRREGTSGAIVLDLQEGEANVRYVASDDPELTALGLGALVAWCQVRSEGTYIAYAIHTKPGDVETGVTNIGGVTGFRPGR